MGSALWRICKLTDFDGKLGCIKLLEKWKWTMEVYDPVSYDLSTNINTINCYTTFKQLSKVISFIIGVRCLYIRTSPLQLINWPTEHDYFRKFTKQAMMFNQPLKALHPEPRTISLQDPWMYPVFCPWDSITSFRFYRTNLAFTTPNCLVMHTSITVWGIDMSTF